MWPLIGSAIGAGSSLLGAFMGSKANAQAAQQAEQAYQTGIDQLTTTNNQVQGQLQAGAQQTAPGTSYLRGVVAAPQDLTAAQKLALDDIRRNETNTIRTSALQGSGRTAAALLRDTENRFTLDALDKNRARADTAAGTLANENYGYNIGAANTAADFGKSIASLSTQKGLVPAQETLANGQLWGKALGDVGSAIAKGFGGGGGSGGGGSSFWNFMGGGGKGTANVNA